MTFFREIELGIPISFQFLFSLLKIIREIHFHKKIFVISFFRTENIFPFGLFSFLRDVNVPKNVFHQPNLLCAQLNQLAEPIVKDEEKVRP